MAVDNVRTTPSAAPDEEDGPASETDSESNSQNTSQNTDEVENPEAVDEKDE